MYVLRQYLSPHHNGALLHKKGTIQECCAEIAKICGSTFPNKTIRQLMDCGFRIEPHIPSLPRYEDINKLDEIIDAQAKHYTTTRQHFINFMADCAEAQEIIEEEEKACA